MKLFNNHVHALLLAVTVGLCVPTYAMENEFVDTYVLEQQFEQEDEQVTEEVWYKKCSVKQIACAAVICSVAAYAIAVRMNKVSSPFAFWTTLLALKTTPTTQVITENTTGNKGVLQNDNGDKDKPVDDSSDAHGQGTPDNDNSEPVVIKDPQDNSAKAEDQASVFSWITEFAQKIQNFDYAGSTKSVLSDDSF